MFIIKKTWLLVLLVGLFVAPYTFNIVTGCGGGGSAAPTPPASLPISLESINRIEGSDFNFMSIESAMYVRAAANSSGTFAFVTEDNRTINHSIYGASFTSEDIASASESPLGRELLADISISPVEVFIPGEYNGNKVTETLAGICQDRNGNSVVVYYTSSTAWGSASYAAVKRDDQWRISELDPEDVSGGVSNLACGTDGVLHTTFGIQGDLYYRRADDTDDDGIYETLSDYTKISDSAFGSIDERIVVSGNYIYVAWVGIEEEGVGGVNEEVYLDMSQIGSNEFGADIKVVDAAGHIALASPAEGIIYLAWTYWDGAEVYFSKSTDHGASWGPTKTLQDEGVIGVGPILWSGDNVYVFWDYDLGFNKSSDGGDTWDSEDGWEISIAGVGQWDVDNRGTTVGFISDGTIYLAIPYNTDPDNPNAGDMVVVKSTDQGTTWTDMGLGTSSYYWNAPKILPTGSGGFELVWRDGSTDVGYGDISFVTSDGTSFGSPEASIAVGRGADIRFPDIAVGENIYTVAVDNRNDSGGEVIFASHGTSLNSSKDPTIISTEEAAIRVLPRIEVDPDTSRIYIFWTSYTVVENSSIGDIYMSYSGNQGASWTSPAKVTDLGSGVTSGLQEMRSAYPLSIAFYQSKIYLLYVNYLYQQSGETTSDLMLAISSDNGASWTDNRIGGFTGISILGYKLVIDSSGNLHMVSFTSEEGRYRSSYSNSSDDGANWSNPKLIASDEYASIDESGGFVLANIAVDSNDVLTIAYLLITPNPTYEKNGKSYFIQSTNGGVSWDDPTVIDGDAIGPNCSISSDVLFLLSTDLAVGKDDTLIYGVIDRHSGANRAYLYTITY